MRKFADQAKACADLVKEFTDGAAGKAGIGSGEPAGGAAKGRRLSFTGVGDRDVYNVTAPFRDRGETVIAGRVEARDTEVSEVMFFVERNGVWRPRDGAPVFALQDPFYTFIGDELVFGGVEVYFDERDPHYVTSWRTVFYRGWDVDSLEPFTLGPMTMKDIRLIALPSGKIGVFTRPMLVDGARALIGYTELDSLEELSEERIVTAHLFRNQFLPDEWGGANEIHLLSNGLIGVLGHIARMEEHNIRHYYPMVFVYDPVRGAVSPIKVIACREMFPDGPAKRPDLADVLFSGGLVRGANGKASLYTGVSDAEAHVIEIDDPFAEYEV